MSVPTFVATTSSQNDNAAVSAAWPAGHQADDIGILIVHSANQTIATPSGWTLIESVGTGTAGAAGAVRVAAFWKLATSAAESNVTVADTGDHQFCRILVFRGCETSGSPIDASASDTAVSGTAVSLPSVTTTDIERMIVQVVGNAFDGTGNQTTAGGWSNAALTSVTRRYSGNSATGTGGGTDLATGEKATAGAVGSTTVTLANASVQALITFALKPPGGGGGGAVTEGGIYVASAVKATAGATGATTAALDTASVQARVTFALKPPTAPPVNQAPVVSGVPALVGAIGQVVTFPVVASDPEGDTLTYSLEAGDTLVPSGAELLEDEASGNYHFEWSPVEGQAGEWLFNVRVTDGTNTVDTPVSVTVIDEPDTTLLALAQAIANRAQTDIESAQALADMLDETQQMNANVITEVRALVADLQVSMDYMNEVIAQLEEEAEAT